MTRASVPKPDYSPEPISRAELILLKQSLQSESASQQREVAAVFQHAAQQGDAYAQHQLAGAYYRGLGVPADEATGLFWLQQAAAQKYLPAQYNLALMRLRGEGGVEVDGDEARQALQTMAGVGYQPAIEMLARDCAERGLNEQAVLWAEKIAATNPDMCLLLAQLADAAGQPQVVLTYLQQAAALGSAAAAWDLAVYCDGHNDAVRACQYYAQAAQQAYVPAQRQLGLCLLRGYGCDVDPAQAVSWLQKAVQGGDGVACEALGKLYLFGQGVQQDFTAARPLLLQAAEQGCVESKYHLAKLYRFGLGVDKNTVVAAEWLKKAALDGEPRAVAEWTSRTETGVPEAEQVLQAEEQRLFQQDFEAGLQAQYGLVPNLAKARALYERAARAGHRRAQTNLGMLLLHEQDTSACLSEALEWFTCAAGQGDALACYNLACLHYRGQGVPVQLPMAIHYLKQAIYIGHPQVRQWQDLLQQWENELPKTDSTL